LLDHPDGWSGFAPELPSSEKREASFKQVVAELKK
jgi:hypothetical protein